MPLVHFCFHSTSEELIWWVSCMDISRHWNNSGEKWVYKSNKIQRIVSTHLKQIPMCKPWWRAELMLTVKRFWIPLDLTDLLLRMLSWNKEVKSKVTSVVIETGEAGLFL